MSKTTTLQDTITLEQAAQRYGFPVHYLRGQAKKGTLSARQQWLTTPQAIEALIASNARRLNGKNKKKNNARHQLASKLRILRSARGWAQEDLSQASGLHRTYVSLVERAGCNVSLDNIERLADALAVSPSDLLSIDGSTNGPSVSTATKPKVNKTRKR
ncbi:MAG: helix-turn-helix transcriptional regulator [Gammaproteobacteria bacterium]|nr:helix-turn-helix transcriptional regulator [Gammaproteobacteria bacterium]